MTGKKGCGFDAVRREIEKMKGLVRKLLEITGSVIIVPQCAK